MVDFPNLKRKCVDKMAVHKLRIEFATILLICYSYGKESPFP